MILTNELWYIIIPYHFQPSYTRNESMVCTSTPEKKKERKKKNTKKEKKGKYTEGKEKKESEVSKR